MFSMLSEESDEYMVAEFSDERELLCARSRCLAARLRRRYNVAAITAIPKIAPIAVSAMTVFEFPALLGGAAGARLEVVFGEAASEICAFKGVNGTG